MSIALGLLIAEIFIPSGFVLLVIGFSFLCTGAMVLIGVSDPVWLQYLICTLFIFAFMVLLRKRLMHLFGLDKPSAYNEIANAEITINEEILPGQIGQGQMQGTSWKVRNTGTSSLMPGDRCKVEKIDGLTVEAKK